MNSIDHTFPYLLLGSKDKQLNTLDPRSRLSMQIFLIWSTMVKSRLIPKTEIYDCCQINLVSIVKYRKFFQNQVLVVQTDYYKLALLVIPDELFLLIKYYSNM